MSTIRVNSIQHTTANSGNMMLHANGNVSMLTANSTLFIGNTSISNAGISVSGSAVSPFGGMKNRIINGDMRIDQRNAGASANNQASGVFSVDRWMTYGSQASKFSFQQNAGSVTPPPGFTNYLGVTSLTSYSITSTDYNYVLQTIEGYNAADLDLGKSTSKSVTFSFWVRSSLTGTFGGSFYQSGSRNFPFSYVINSANTWEYKTITVPPDTSGTSYNTTNSAALYLIFGLGSGATYSSGAAGSWSTSNNIQASGTVSLLGTQGATWYITGVQMEEGTVATPFERRSYGTELALCKRYYYQIQSGTAAVDLLINGYNYTTVQWESVVTHPVEMRVVPTVTFTATNTFNLRIAGTISALSVYYSDTTLARNVLLIYVPGSGMTQGYSQALMSASGSKAGIYFNAEM